MASSSDAAPNGHDSSNGRSDSPPTGSDTTVSSRFVTAALLEFGATLVQKSAGRVPTTSVADSYVRSHPFGFLVAVILDQGVPAERAWAAPSMLRDRLGTLEPAHLVGIESEVRAAFRRRPMPHRFPRLGADWVLAAARRVVDRYAGDARTIWDDEPTARVLQARFEGFAGIGQKKAAMAVEILASEHGVTVRDMAGSDVAYDIHVRRVFLRSGLVARDTPTAVIDAARRLHPDRPGSLDVPAWTVGRTWCRPRRPACDACPIGWACPSAPPPSIALWLAPRASTAQAASG